MKYGWLVTLLVVGGAGYGGWYFWHTRAHREIKIAYRSVKVERGDVVQIVRATGIVQPVKLVQVGTQVNGIVQKLYVDFNSRVQAGDIIARIDPSVYQANLSQSEANLTRSHAAVDEARAGLLKASNDLVRATGLAANQMISRADLDVAVANAASAGAQLKVAVAQVQQTSAALDLARANLGYTVIATPVNGVVVSRNVDEGQTVVASMSAQTLFTIATDLRTVLINASVPEADIGPVSVGQNVTFNVDAYPTTFTGTVNQIRLAASTVQNVVTYPVMVCASNPEEKLFPGMTANISCIIAARTNVLRVANAALRFKPPKTEHDRAAPKTAHVSSAGASSAGEDRKRGRLWVAGTNQVLRPVRVTLGITDGTTTEVSGEALVEGLEAITGALENGAKNTVVNPFMPTPSTPQTRPPRL
jgi:HlyD family secretion protein